MELLDTKRYQAPEFTRLSYHTSEARAFWAPAIQGASRIVSVAEMESVVQGLRPCGTLHIPNVDGDRVYARLARAGLKWKRLTKVGKSAGGFSHRRHPSVKEGDPNFSWFSVMGRTQKDVDDFSLGHVKSNHDLMGKQLGFPACCRRFFTRNWPKYCDPIWQAAANTPGAEYRIDKHVQFAQGLQPTADGEGAYPETVTHRIHIKGHPGCNAALRYVGARTWFHLPCSFQCEESIEKAEQWLTMMKELDPKAYLATKYLLSLPLAWDVCHGYTKVITPAFTVHAGSTESKHRYVVEYEADPSSLPASDIPGAANGLEWPMRPGDINTAPLMAAGPGGLT
jgi:hypothetical protein